MKTLFFGKEPQSSWTKVKIALDQREYFLPPSLFLLLLLSRALSSPGGLPYPFGALAVPL